MENFLIILSDEYKIYLYYYDFKVSIKDANLSITCCNEKPNEVAISIQHNKEISRYINFFVPTDQIIKCISYKLYYELLYRLFCNVLSSGIEERKQNKYIREILNLSSYINSLSCDSNYKILISNNITWSFIQIKDKNDGRKDALSLVLQHVNIYDKKENSITYRVFCYHNEMKEEDIFKHLNDKDKVAFLMNKESL